MNNPEISTWVDVKVGNYSPLSMSAQTFSAPSYDPDLLHHVETLTVYPKAESRLVSMIDQESIAAEAFRLLSIRLRTLRRQQNLKKLLITSTIPQEGKSMVSGNIACSLANEQQERVLLLEGDIRRPSLSKMFGIQKHAGLCEWLRKEANLSQCISYIPDAHLWILLAGQNNGNPLDIIQSQRLTPLMTQLNGMFDWVIVDSPPELPLVDVSVWSALVDGILLVTRYGTTKKKELQRSIKSIDSQKLIGTILNCSRNVQHRDYYYGYSSHGMDDV